MGNQGGMMEKTWISNVTPKGKSALFPLIIVTSLSACASQKPAETMSFVEPPMAWDAHPEAEGWTDSTLIALSTKDEQLSDQVPADIAGWCPGYEEAPIEARRAFWAGLVSSVAKYESTWNPMASGGGGRWIGLMQISPRSAKYYGCDATSVAALKDGEANLECAVDIMSEQVARDGLVAGDGSLGVGRDWAPLRSEEKRAEMAAWTSTQPYCTAG